MQGTPAAEKEVPTVKGKGLFSKPTPVPTVLLPAITVPAVTVPAVPVSGEGLDALNSTGCVHSVWNQTLIQDCRLGKLAIMTRICKASCCNVW